MMEKGIFFNLTNAIYYKIVFLHLTLKIWNLGIRNIIVYCLNFIQTIYNITIQT
jgi:hypothetical protein